MKEPLLSEGEIQTTFKAIETFPCVMYGIKKCTSIGEAQLDIFFKKYKPNKNDNFSEGTIGEFTVAAYHHTFKCYKKRFCE